MGEAAALAPVQLTGSAPATAHGPGTVSFSYTLVLPTAVDATVFTTHQAAELPASSTGVLLDGVAVPAAQLSRPDPADLAIQAGADPADGLSAGSHTVTVTATLAAGAAASTSSAATLSWTIGGVPDSITSAAVPVAVNQPDLALALTPDTGEEQLGLLGTGRDLDLAVDVRNLGYGTPASSLLVTLPAGLTLGPATLSRQSDGSTLSCTADPGNPQLLSCPLGSIEHDTGANPTLDLDLAALPGASIGQVVPVTVAVTADPAQGSDTDPSNNSATVHLQYTGSARLSYTITPAASRVVLGGRTTVRLTVHNAGPQLAPATIAFAILVGDNFAVASFSGKTTGPVGIPAAAAPVGSSSGAQLLWLAGDIAPGHSASAVLTIQARRLGVGKVGLAAFSGAGDPNCPNFDCAPSTVSVRAVAAPAVPVAAAAGGAGLAATGQRTGSTVGLGGGLLLAGAGLLLLGRRPRPAR
ncbi:MAG: hypothetical protein ACR2N4_08185 [Jatrophihabitans sp.]